MVGTARCAVREVGQKKDGPRSAAPLPAVPAIETRDFAFRLSIGRALFQVSPFIVSDFALADTDLGLQLSIFPIQAQDDKSAAGDRAQAIKFVDLLAVKKKFSDAFRS